MDAKVQELAYVKAYADHVKATAIIDAGDAFQGLPLNNLTKGEKMAEIMNAIGYDAMAVGNHEFDYTRRVALGLDDGWKKAATFPILSSNILYDDASLGTVGSPVYKPGVVLSDKLDSNNNPIKISVIGASTPETYVKADPRHTEGLKITDPIEAVKTEILKAEYADSHVYIVTVHLGTDKETKVGWRGDTLADELSKMPELANKKIVVIDGHSHSVYPNGLTFGGNVIYGQTGGSLANLGKITVNLENFKDSKAELIQVRDGYDLGEIGKYLSPDKTISDLLKAADAEFDELTKGVVLEKAPVELVGVRNIVRTRETNLGNLITDSMLEYALDTFPERSDVAVLNGGGIRNSIAKGSKITLKEVLSVMPYGNRIVQIDVTGEQLYAMYEHALKAPAHETDVDANGVPLLQSDPAILHSSDSIRVHFDPRLPIGERVFKIQLMDQNTGKLVDVDMAKTYKVVTLEFLAVGGDGFTMLGGARVEGANDADIFADYLMMENENPFIDWTAYDPELPPYRVLPTKMVAEESLTEEKIAAFTKLFTNAKTYFDNEEKYTKDSFKLFSDEYAKAKVINDKLVAKESVTAADLEKAHTDLDMAIKGLKSVIPSTGIYTGASAMASITVAMGALFVLRKRK